MTDFPIAREVHAVLLRVASSRGVVLDATPEEANIFLDLGFDSIQIVEITAELESSLGVELPMQRWLDEQSYLDACSFTVASLIELCSAVVRDAEKEETP